MCKGRQRALCAAICFVFAMSIFAGSPVMADAATVGTASAVVTPQNAAETASKLSLSIGEGDFNPEDSPLSRPLFDTGWSWDPDTLTIALDSSYTGEEIYVYSEEEIDDIINITIDGSVQIEEGIIARISSGLSISATGTPSLEISNGYLGVQAISTESAIPNLAIDGIDLAIDAEDDVYSIYSDGDISIQNATVSTSNSDYGIYAEGNLNILESDLTIADSDIGLWSNNNLKIDGPDTNVSITGAEDYSIRSDGNLTIQDGVTVGISGSDYGVYAVGALTVSVSDLTITGSATGLRSDGDLKLQQNSGVTITGSETGIYASGQIILSGDSQLIAASTDSGLSSDGNLSITGNSNVAITGATAGVYTGGNFNLSGSALTTANSGTGLQSAGNAVVQNDSTIGITGAENAVISGGTFTLSGSRLTAKGSDLGFNASGNVAISGSALTASGGASGIGAYVSGGNVVISNASAVNLSGGYGIYVAKESNKGGNISVDASNLTSSALAVSGGVFTIDHNSVVKLTGKAKTPAASFLPAKPIEIRDSDSKVTLVNATGLTSGYYTVSFKRPAGLSGYVWKVTPGSSFLDPSAATTDTITVKQLKETAVIELLPAAQAEYYLAIASNPASGGGTATGPAGYYAAGAKISIKATPNTAKGYVFNGWVSIGGGTFADAKKASTTFTMPEGGATVTAQFPKTPKDGDVVKDPATGKTYVNYALVASIKDQAQTGKQIKPTLSVKVGGKVLKKDKDYTVKYSPNKNVGLGYVTITAKGSYTGKKVVSFNIVPAKTVISKTTPSKKKLKVTWKKVAGVTKYEIQYRVKGTKKWSVATASAKAKSVTLKRLKKGKAYQVQVRSYKTVSKVKYTSAWSKAKISKKIK